MSARHIKRTMVRLVFWAVAAALIFAFVVNSYTSGEMVNWFYYRASLDGYAIDDRAFMDATTEQPAFVTIVQQDFISGPQAVRVRAGDLMPRGANGVIADAEVQDGKRVALEGNRIKVMVPTQLKEAKGITYKDTYKHKGIQTNPLSGPWNVLVVLTMGLTMGMLAQALTDLFGLEFKQATKASAH
ncbi:MAG: hypothetical protein ACYC4L_11275 [Chloroflexota bacterium]